MSRSSQIFTHKTSISKHIVRWLSLLISVYFFVTTVQADAIKNFYASGVGRECEGGFCHDFPLFGHLSYIDPNPNDDNIIQLSSGILLVLNIGQMGPLVLPESDFQPGASIPFTTLVIPYVPPISRPDLGPNLTIYELGRGITVHLNAFSDFDGDGTGARTWNITTSGKFTWDTGHGEKISGPIAWHLPEPTTIYLLSIGLVGLLARRL